MNHESPPRFKFTESFATAIKAVSPKQHPGYCGKFTVLVLDEDFCLVSQQSQEQSDKLRRTVTGHVCD
jgi:hypothetical protein